MTGDQRRFEGILDRHFEAVLEDNPVYANYCGLTTGDGRLGEASRAFETRQEKRRQKSLAALDSVSPDQLSPDQQIDRLALRARLCRESEEFSRRRSAFDPAGLDHVLNILLHELQRVGSEAGRSARNLRALLAELPDYLDTAAKMIDRPEPVWRRIMEQSADGAGTLFDAVGIFLAAHGPPNGDEAALQGARKAVTRYRDAVAARRLAPVGSFAIGADRLQRRVRDELGLDYSLGQIEALANSEIVRVGTLLDAACRPFGRGRRAEDIIADARGDWDPGADLLGLYRRETERLSRAFRRAGAMTFPERETLEVRPVPEFMRPLFPTAAYSSPGAFERRQRGIFWVNDLGAVAPDAATARRERQQHFGLNLTCAHEAYPGHHLQFTTANRHPRRWRRLFAHAVFYEGWTLWCEQMMVDLKIDRSPWLRVQQLNDALWRCHRILVDLRLQTGRYDYAAAVRHLQRHLGFTRPRAEGDVNWYTGSPGVPMSYWLGRLENERLRRRLVDGRGWTLRRFNDWLLSFGTVPQSWIEQYGLD